MRQRSIVKTATIILSSALLSGVAMGALPKESLQANDMVITKNLPALALDSGNVNAKTIQSIFIDLYQPIQLNKTNIYRHFREEPTETLSLK